MLMVKELSSRAKAKNSDFVLYWCSISNTPDLALILTFKPTFVVKSNSTLSMSVASSQFSVKHRQVGRYIAMT